MAGTDRMAGIVAAVRWSRANGSPLHQALPMLPDDVDVVRGVVTQDGRPVPILVVGSFGVAVIAEMERPDRLRRVDGSWQARTSEGWSPTEQPVDQTAREADRVRHWLNHGELDFVVRAHAALVTTDVDHPSLATVRGAHRRAGPGLDRLAAAPAQHHRRQAPRPRRPGQGCGAAIRAPVTAPRLTRGSSPVG